MVAPAGRPMPADHPWVGARGRRRSYPRHCVLCGGPSPRAKTCAGCRWLEAQETGRAREWDEIDPDRNEWQHSRELPWTVQGLLSVEVAFQQALSPEDIQLRQEQAREEARRDRDWHRRQIESDQRRAAEAQAETRVRKAAATARHRAAEHAKSAAIRARTEMDFSRYRGQLGSAPTASEIVSVQAALDGWQPGPTTEADVRAAHAAGSPMMEPPPGTREFRHAMAVTGLTCTTPQGTARCQCGFYRMTWTEAEARG
jgi:hypothetical protein